MLWLLFIVASALPVLLYNSLMRRRNQVDFAFATVDALLKQRHDLIPALIETTQAHAQHERELLLQLANLRSRLESNRGMQGRHDGHRLRNESMLEHNLLSVLAWVENYPQLQAQQSFHSLQRALVDNEAQIAAARRFYNAAVNDYNDSIYSFPSNLVAQALGWQRKPYFQLHPKQRPAIGLSSREQQG